MTGQAMPGDPAVEQGICTGLGRRVRHRHRLHEARGSANDHQQIFVPPTWREGATNVYMYVAEPPLWDWEIPYMRVFHF